MPTISEEELEAIQLNNERLREEIAQTKSSIEEHSGDRTREVRAAELMAEGLRLEAELASVKRQEEVIGNPESVASVVEASANAFERAKLQLENPQGLVDTNVENQPEGTTGETFAVEGGIVTTDSNGLTTVVAPDAAEEVQKPVETDKAKDKPSVPVAQTTTPGSTPGTTPPPPPTGAGDTSTGPNGGTN